MLDDDLFASDGIVAMPVTIGGKKRTLHFRELPAVEFHACFIAPEGGGQKVLSPSHLIAAAMRNPDGTPAITVDRAAQLKTAPFNAIFAAIMELNGEAPGNASPSAEKSGSGTP